MIKINYDIDSIRVETSNLNSVFTEHQLPLQFEFVKQVNGRKIWDVKLNSNSWANFPDTEMIDVVVKDNNDKHLFTRKWNVLIDGSFIYQKLWNYCLNTNNPKGVVVGTHNGEFGEWVPTALNQQSEMILIEASEKQYSELLNNFGVFENLQFVNKLVTDNGETVTFYEGGKGYTNSVEKRVIEFWETEEISATIRESIKFSDLIDNSINWIHLDVEGIDDKLLYTLSDIQYNNLGLIIFEYNNLTTEKREEINNFIISKGFTTFREKGICVAYK